MRHAPAVPPLGEHRDGHDAPDVLAELALLADRVEHLPHQVLVFHLQHVAAGKPPAVLGLELLDLVPGELLEVVGHALAGLELPAVHEDRVRPVQPAPTLLVVEQLQRAGRDDRLAVGVVVFGLVAGEVIEDRLADVGVVADDYEHRATIVDADLPCRAGVSPR